MPFQPASLSARLSGSAGSRAPPRRLWGVPSIPWVPGAEKDRCLLLSPGGEEGSVPRHVLARIARVNKAALSCHDVAGVSLADKCDLLRRAGTGDQEAVCCLGLVLSPEEAAEAVELLRADVALRAKDDDPELAVSRKQASTPDLLVKIISARGLRDADWLPGSGLMCGKSDPYCICEIKGKPNSKFQTLVIEDDLNPVWNRQEIMEDYVVGDDLEFEVWDKDYGKKDDFLGRFTLTLEQFHPRGFEGEVRLEDAGKAKEAFLKIKVTTSQVMHEELRELPFAVADALKWLAWNEAWLASLSRANSGSRPLLVDDHSAKTGLPPAERLRPGIRQRLAEKARSHWAAACESQGALTDALADALAAAAGAVARHTAARGVFPRHLATARTEWNTFTDALLAAAAEGSLGEDLRTEVKWLLWNAAWHATNLVSMHQGEGDADDEEEEEAAEEAEDDLDHMGMEDTELFGDEEYPGYEQEPLENLSHFLQHAGRLHRCDDFGCSGEPWRGLCLTATAKESAVQNAAMAGFNTIRLSLPPARGSTDDVLKSVMPMLKACDKAGMHAVLDCLGCSLRGSQGMEALCRSLSAVAAATSDPNGPTVRAVALPRLTSPQAAVPLVEALRSGGLRPENCAIIIQLEDAPVDLDGNHCGFFRKALLQGEQGLLLSDGHIVFEVYRKLPEHSDGPMALLDAASSSGPESSLPMGCSRWGLTVPSQLSAPCSALGERWREELASRFEAGSGNSTHGWFCILDDATGKTVRTIPSGSLQMCLQRRWRWPEPMADRTLFTHGTPHVASLIYLHGFTCDGIGYLPCHDYFRKEIILPALGEGDDEDEEPEYLYVPLPGLKVILPSAPVRAVSCYGGQKYRSWYDYRTDFQGEREDELSEETLKEVTWRLHRCLDAEASLLGGPERVMLGGASQGAAVALHAALTYPGHLGGVLATQGHLLECTPVSSEWAARETPVRVFCGLQDSTMPWDSWVSNTYNRMRNTGCNIQCHTEEGVDHGDGDAEGRWVRSFLQEMWIHLGFDAA